MATIPIAITGSADDLAQEVKIRFDEILSDDNFESVNVNAVDIDPDNNDLVFTIDVD